MLNHYAENQLNGFHFTMLKLYLHSKIFNGYLCHLIFTLSKFTLKNFLIFEMVSTTKVSPSIFLILNTTHILITCKTQEKFNFSQHRENGNFG